MKENVQPLAKSTPWMRSTVDVEVEVDSAGDVASFAFSKARGDVEFRFSSPISMLVMNLETKSHGTGLQPVHTARLTSHPVQFKSSETGQPIPIPELVRVHRFGDFCCALEVHGAVLEEVRYAFHLVVIVGENLVGSPDPTVVIEAPPCTGPECEDPPN